MRRTLLAMCAAMTAVLTICAQPVKGAPALAPGPRLDLGGCVVRSDADDYQTGLFGIRADGTLAPLTLAPEAWATGGGTMVDGIYYCTCIEEIWTGFYYMTGFAFDSDTWEQLDAYNLGTDLSFVATDMTCDHTTGRIYGCFYDGTFDAYEFGTMEYGTEVSRRETIAPLAVGLQAIATAADGTLYAVDFDGRLVTVDKATGTCTAIGDTGLKSEGMASATIDPQTGTMYMTVKDGHGSRLCTIDTATAAATTVCTFANGEEITGLFIYDSTQTDKPEAATALTATFAGNALTGTVAFTAPDKTRGGDALTGELPFTVTANGATVATGTTTPGAATEATATLPASGLYTIEVEVSNTLGAGPTASTTIYAGDDTPAPVQDVRLAISATTAEVACQLQWTAATGTHGGFIDPLTTTYRVVRIADGTETTVAHALAATTFAETLPMPTGRTTLKYSVTATYLDAASEAAASNAVLIGTTDIALPYTEDFETEGILDMFTVVDANADGKTWQVVEVDGNHVARVEYNSAMAMDDWLITAPLPLEAGKTYCISFRASGNSPSFTEHVEAFVADAPTADAMLEGYRVAERTELAKSYVTFTKAFTPTRSGNYHLGIHGCSAADRYFLDVDDISVTVGDPMATPGAALVEAVADEGGALQAELHITAPTLTQAGNRLTAIDRIDIERDGAIVGTIADVVPGGTYTFTDETIAHNGTTEWTVVAVNADGPGAPAHATAYVGVDVPAAVAGISVVEVADGRVRISWTAPDTDINGRPIGSGLTYKIVDAGYRTVAEDITATEFEYDAVEAGDQDFVYYYIGAANEVGMGSFSVSAMTLIGTPYAYPYAESFDNGSIASIVGVETPEGSYAEWEVYTDESAQIEDADGTNGFIGMYGYAKGEQSSLYTGKIALDGAQRPALSFYYNALTADNRNTMEVAVREAGASHWTVLKDFVEEGATRDYEWIRMVLPLDDYKGRTIQLRWTPTVVNYPYGLIDGIKVGEAIAHDLSVRGIAAPARVEANKEFEVRVTVANDGTEPAEGYTVALLRDGEQVQSMGGNTFVGGTQKTFVFVETLGVTASSAAYSATVVYTPDADTANNATTRDATVSVKLPSYPTASNLTATVDDGGVTLAWSAPDLTDLPLASVTEDFEAAAPLAQAVEGWTFVDDDNAAIGGIAGVTLPFDKASWFVVDSADPAFGRSFASHSGTRHLATMFNYNGEDNDDWLISPELCGEAQTISLWAKSYVADYGLEHMELLYSVTDRQTSSFEAVAEVDVPAEWTEFTFSVPQGTRHFAIRCTSHDVYMLFVDDVTYTPANAVAQDYTIAAYNIYRDGTLIGTVPSSATTCRDTAAPGQHTYLVTVVYTQGESAPSNKAVVDVPDAIAKVAPSGFTVTTAPGAIIVHSTLDADIRVFTVDGRPVAHAKPQPRTVIRVLPGTYIIRIANNCHVTHIP